MSRRWRRALVILPLVTAAGLLLVEGALRLLLFRGDALPAGFLSRLRQAREYADYQSDDDYWKLALLAEQSQSRPPAHLFHPELGWISPRFAQTDLRHHEAQDLRGRRPVLLYGDSFASCVTPPEECFEAILARSELSERYALLNYGVQAYGLDQIWMLARETVRLYADQRPVVVVSLLLDDDLDRSWLRIRGWPKPRFRVEGEALVKERERVPTIDEFLVEHPIGIRSYFASHLVNGTDWLPLRLRAWLRDEERVREGKRELNRRILEELHADLERCGCEYFFLLFEGEHYLAGRWSPGWRHELVLSFLRERRVPYVLASRPLLDRAAWEGRRVESYFGGQGEGVLSEHLTAEGNEVVFAALRDGLEGLFEPSDPAPLDPGELTVVRGAGARLERGSPTFAGHREIARLRLPAGTEVRYDLDRKCAAFEARARARGAPRGEEQPRLVVEADGEPLLDAIVVPGEDLALRMDLGGRGVLRLRAEGPPQTEVVLGLPRFR